MELGIYSFADVTEDPVTGRAISPSERLHNLVEEIELADQAGLDVYGVGEHHRPDYASSAPAVVLAAAAARTSRIRLTSAVTVLSSDDPVRVFQQFSTLDLLSDGRAEIMAGRGSFIESFPLFGFALDDYDELFAEKLDLLLKLRDQERVTWSGWQSAELRRRRSAAAAWVCRWRSRSLAAWRRTWLGSSTSTASLRAEAVMTRLPCRSPSIPMGTLQTRWTKRLKTVSCHTRRPWTGSAASAAGRR